MKRAFPNLLFFAVPYISRKEKTPEQTEEGEETVITKTESKPGKAKELEDGSTQTAKKAIEDAGDKPETSASETMESTSEAASAETMESTSEAAIAKTKAGTPKKGKTDTRKSAEDQSTYDAEFQELKARVRAIETLRSIRKDHTGPSGIFSETEEPLAYEFGLNTPGLIAVYQGDHVSQELLKKKKICSLDNVHFLLSQGYMSEHIFDHTECIFRAVGFTRNFPVHMCVRDPAILMINATRPGFRVMWLRLHILKLTSRILINGH